MPNPIQMFLVLATCGASVLLAAGFLGRFHGLGDSLAVYRTALSCLLLVLAILLAATGLRWPGALAGSFAALALITVLSHWWPAPGQAAAAGPGVTVYQKNLWTRLATPEDMVAEILASGADVVTLQEVGRRAGPVLEGLRGAYPTQVVCPYATVGGVAVLSRFPERPGSRDCVPLSGLVSTVLETPDGPLRAAAIHLKWPWPRDQRGQVTAMLDRLGGWPEPAVIGGDFNTVRWAWALREIARASGTRPVGPARITFRNGRLLLFVGIDHVLATGGQGTTELRPRAGSDHEGLRARITLPVRQAPISRGSRG